MWMIDEKVSKLPVIYFVLMIELDSWPLFPRISSRAPSDTKCSTYELKALVIWSVKLVLYSYFPDLTNEIGLSLIHKWFIIWCFEFNYWRGWYDPYKILQILFPVFWNKGISLMNIQISRIYSVSWTLLTLAFDVNRKLKTSWRLFIDPSVTIISSLRPNAS